MFVKENQDRKNNNQAMCNYLQYEQCHYIDLVNLLITLREMFSLFCDTSCEMHHILPCSNWIFNMAQNFNMVQLFCRGQNTSTMEILKCICNCINPAINRFFLADKSEWLFVVANCPTEKG